MTLKKSMFTCSLFLLSTFVGGAVSAEEAPTPAPSLLSIHGGNLLEVPEAFPKQFLYDTGVDIAYPADGVKGIYVTGHSAGGSRMETLVDLLDRTALNAMVIDIKDDFGDMTTDLDSEDPLINEVSKSYFDAEKVISQMDEKDIYPIARIVVFKDTRLAEKRPELAFQNSDGSVWKNRRGEAFVSPFSKEVWDYNVEVAKQAAKLGFKEIQFDYVRFPEGFELRADELTYDKGGYVDENGDDIKERVDAVTDFVAYAREQLTPFDVEVSVDIFGYSATEKEAPGIGQNFSRISENVDVISSMIYPSHWGNGYFNIAVPDLEPYRLVSEYMEVENEVLSQLENSPTSRPWLQDFTASYLGSGNYKTYGPKEIEDQIRALYEHDVKEFLLWDAGNTYTEGVNYMLE